MSNDIIIIGILWAISFIVAFQFLPAWRKHHDADKSLHARTMEDNKLSVDYALKQMNCKGKWTKTDAGLDVRFQYQSGHFGIQLRKDSPYLRLFYLFFLDAPLSDVELIRSLCNQSNQSAETCRLVYSVDERQGKIDVHILSTLLVTDSTVVEVLERAFGDVFSWHAAFAHRYNELKQASRDGDTDKEKSRAITNHELFLLREMEMAHQPGGPDWHAFEGEGRSLRQFIAATLSLTDIVPISLSITKDNKIRTIDSLKDILSLNFEKEIIADGQFVAPSVVMHLDYYDPHDPRSVRHLLLDFESQGQTDEVLYYRASVMVVPASMQKDMPADSEETDRRVSSVLIGADLQPESKQQEKFKYIWKEALAKSSADSEEKLSPDEQVLVGLRSPDIGRIFYEGRMLFLEKRYYEAALRFESLLRLITPKVAAGSKRQQYHYEVLCYHLGFCLLQLGQYQRAAYYLEFTLPLHNLLYTEAYINSLVMMGDIRTINVIDSLLAEVEPEEDDEEEEESLPNGQIQTEFINFLKRRKASVLVRLERFDEAETLLKKLLDDPESSDFALKELAHIQKLRGN